MGRVVIIGTILSVTRDIFDHTVCCMVTGDRDRLKRHWMNMKLDKKNNNNNNNSCRHYLSLAWTDSQRKKDGDCDSMIWYCQSYFSITNNYNTICFVRSPNWSVLFDKRLSRSNTKVPVLSGVIERRNSKLFRVVMGIQSTFDLLDCMSKQILNS